MAIELLQIDCMKYMETLPDNAFDIAIVDPPYGIGEDGSKSATRGSRGVFARDYKPFYGNDKESPAVDYFNELQRVSVNQIIWGANHFISKIPKDSSCWIVWDKLNGSTDFADCELAYTSFSTAVRKFSFRWSGYLQGDMARKEERIHPTQKPVKLYEWLLINYAKKNCKVLDTHLGSGSSAIAAHYFDCDFVGCEIDDHYFNLAKERVRYSTRQLSLIS